MPSPDIDRRRLIAAAGAAGAVATLPQWAQSATPPAQDVLSGDHIQLTIGHAPIAIDGKAGHGIAIGERSGHPQPARRVRARGFTDVHLHLVARS
jgi:FtsP/CotA-like multicopper oxidase with cupredoxin domain